MNYEKKYKEAFERAKDYIEKQNPPVNVLYEIFPELKECGDERIRKGILELVRQSSEVLDKQNQNNMIAWLEKQGVQEEPQVYEAENGEVITYSESEGYKVIEPKFHEGDWVVQDCNILKIRCVGVEYYCFETVGGYVDDMLVSEIDSLYHLWTIEDAKDGDVLYSPCCKLLWIYKDDKSCYVGNNLNYCSNYAVINEHILIPTDAIPATKEQRDLLFQKMKEAGYAFDFEKKELKKIEQKPTWIREDEQNLNAALSYINDEYLRRWLKDAIYNKHKKPSEWSEEDEKMCQETIDWFEKKCFPYALEEENPARESIKWLKSLKNGL